LLLLPKRFWTACGLSLALHLLVLLVPPGVGSPGVLPATAGARPLEGSLRRAAPAVAEPAAAELVTAQPDSDRVELVAEPPATPAAASTDTAPPPAPATADDGPLPPAHAGAPLPSRYFKSSEVDRRAEPIAIAPFMYPDAAFRSGLSGRVVLRLYVNETGTIDAIDIVEAEPVCVFEQAAVDAVLNTRFMPAELFGRPVKNVKTIELRLNPRTDEPPAAPTPPTPAPPPTPAAAGN
jgi:protein TonB